jgi:hypothetical protein
MSSNMGNSYVRQGSNVTSNEGKSMTYSQNNNNTSTQSNIKIRAFKPIVSK